MADIGKLFKQCTSAEILGKVLASKLQRYLKSPFSAYCDLYAPKPEQDPPSPFQELLKGRGIEWERRYVERNYPDLAEIAFTDDLDGFRKTLEAMDKGAAALHDMPLFWQDLQGRFDIAEKRTTHGSVFGRHHYIIKEIKSARNIKDHHIIQAAMYNCMLGKIQGYTPLYFFMINADGKEQKESFKEWEKPLMRAIEDVRLLIDGRLKPTPTYGQGEFPWKGYSNRKAVELKDISLVAGVKEATKRKLAEAGIATIKGLVDAKLPALKELGIKDKDAEKMRLSARAILTGKTIVEKIPELPKAKTDVYMDFESTDEPMEADLERIDYLIGMLVCQGKRREYRPFIAHTPDDEGRMFKEFLKFTQGLKDFVLYHWHVYERTRMKHLMDKYKVKAPLREHVFDHMVDLHKVATSAITFPTYGNGLKEIAKWLGFSWRHGEVTAQESIALYLKYAEDNKRHADSLRLILDYNEDDCIATLKVKEYLEGLEG